MIDAKRSKANDDILLLTGGSELIGCIIMYVMMFWIIYLMSSSESESKNVNVCVSKKNYIFFIKQFNLWQNCVFELKNFVVKTARVQGHYIHFL